MNHALGEAEFQTLTGVDDAVLARLKIYAALLAKWQPAINLVSGTTLTDPWRRHFLDSAQLFRHISPASGPPASGPLLDVGTGAGFPGMVLAIMGIKNVELVDSDQRKCIFLQEVSRETQTPVTIHSCRIEDLPAKRYPVVTARACAPMGRLLGHIWSYLDRDTGVALFLKGAQVEQELTSAKKQWMMRYDLVTSISDTRGTIVRMTGFEPRNGGIENG